MAIPLRQSTASQEIPLGTFVDSTDGNTEEPSLTINNTDIKLWKHGATTLASKNSGGASYISNGVYYCTLDDTDTNTLGGLVVFVHVSGALAVRVECVVLPANVYDSLIAGSDYLNAEVAAMAANVMTAAALATDAVTEINAKWTTAMSESYAADGSVPTPEQALQMILQRLVDMFISGTTLTVRKRDGATTAFTLTLNSATSPTDVTQTA